jgi:hypothetical protein
MVRFELLRERGLLVIHPEGALRAEDFLAVAAEVDPYIAEKGGLKGLMVKAPSFPGWESFAALIGHLKFVRDHHRKIARVAVVTDSPILKVAQAVADHLAHPEIELFKPADEAVALRWLEAAGGRP